MGASRDIASALTEPGLPPYRSGQVVGFDFSHQPPVLFVDDIERPMRFLGECADYTYFDSVAWIIYNGAPLVIGRLPQMSGEIEDWHLIGAGGEPAFQNSWTALGGAHAPPGFYIQPDGWVRLKGAATGGTATATIFTLPAGYRPPVDLTFTSVAGGNAACSIEITTAGLVSKPSGGTNAFVSFAGIAFPTVWNRDAWQIPELDTAWNRASMSSPTAELFYRDDGWCWLKGGATGSNGTRIMTLPVNARTVLDHILVGDDIASIGWARMNLSYKGVIAHNSGGATSVHFGGKNWFARAGARSFIAPTFLNSWANLGTTFESAGYYKDHMGVVHLQGAITGSNTSPIFNLPAEYRPTEQQIFFTLTQGEAESRVDVLANGDVQRAAGANGYLSLNGVSFRAEQ